jgi:adenine deaminase
MKKQVYLKKQISQARGLSPADVVLKNCKIVDVFCGDIVQGKDVAICEDRIAGVGNYSGVKEIDCQGAYLAPGFMEGHIHIESSMLSPAQFAQTVIAHGTTTVICDPHEIANVAGLAGIEYFLAESEGVLTEIYCMAPSCVPATHLENSGAKLDSQDLDKLLAHPRILGLAEMMNFPGVLFRDDEVLAKIVSAKQKGLPVDGHAPGLTGKDLQAYIGSGILSDHECTTANEALEKLRAGMYIFIREGSTAKNLESLLPVVTAQNSHRCLLVTDDCHPQELLENGHLDRILRKAINLGLDPVTAIQMVTINVANYYGLRGVGAVAPGYLANLVLFEDLQDLRIEKVFSRGVEYGSGLIKASPLKSDMEKQYPQVFDSIHVNLESLSFAIPAQEKLARVIKVIKNQIITESVELNMKFEENCAVADINRDVLKVAVIERHRATGNIGLGFVQGIGLQRGALASTVGHDSHNITVIGTNDEDMFLAVQTIIKQGGGLAVVVGGEVKANMILDVAGLMSMADAQTVVVNFSELLRTVSTLGVQLTDPFAFMSFLALPVIPHLKITDLGLVDVDAFCHVSLWV